MSVLLLTLAGPLQAWGERSRFVRRETATEPTKSGVVGLLAAATGRRRTDPVEDLAGLTFGVRVDQPGVMLRDFQTARSPDGTKTMPLSYRFYLTDALFMAAVQGPDELIAGLADALQEPAFPLYLGRRACPPTHPIVQQDCVRQGAVLDVLVNEPWRAARWHRRRTRTATPRLILAVDQAAAASAPAEVAERFIDRELPRTVRDQPLSFDPRHRQYGLRSVVRGVVEVSNPDATQVAGPQRAHRPMDELEYW